MRFITLLILLFSTTALAGAPATKVAILMFDKVQIIDFAGPYEIFGQAKFDVYTVSSDGKPVTTAMGLSVNPSHSFADLPPVDIVLVPGGNVQKIMHDKSVLNWIKNRKNDSEHILSVCTGSHILAQAGLLDDQQATTFHRALEGLAKDYPKVEVLHDRRFVDNGQVITTAGLSSGLDGALHLVAKIQGQDAAKTIAMHIEYDWDPSQGFVRGLMADRYLPDNDYQWPEDIQFERLAAFGDKGQWQNRYLAKTEATKEVLQAVYVKAMKAHDQWKSIPAEDGKLSWQATIDTQRWIHSFWLETDADAYLLHQQIKRD
ncbi:DJ-1/PfpI family protein [Aliiglaciecola sp. CAU 1673]|uniref:DJ-1/PfpI family protein n=1 Tax=Aliiglaciecola sp. CAU 1673 TaxID=3032595 RepID=UPI0023DB1A4C|nr:DJ-1/PfpI family protein [Aliiglaciecola sp. CAU 1673]MDF2178625.1 DJ-1/PfpI family protein [Aliiglaciecola sp. CAU 1673]